MINELPIGKVTEVHTTVDAKANVLDLRLVIADQFVQLNSGEIDEHTAGRYIARMPDESILVVTGRNA